MGTIIYFYILPSISAIAIKLIMVWYGRDMIRKANFWLWAFLAGLFAQNSVELLTFMFPYTGEGSTSMHLLQWYYLSSLVSSTAFLALSLHLASLLNRKMAYTVVGLFCLGALVVMLPHVALQGVQSIGYSITRIPGDYYWVLQIILVGAVVGGTLVLVWTTYSGKAWVARRRSLALLVGASPIIVASLLVMALMQAGFSINATIIVSLSVNVLLGVLIYTEYEHGLFKFLSFVPSTRENKLARSATRAAWEVHTGSLNNAVNAFEQAIIVDALEKSNGNKTMAADLLGISRTTLRRKMEAAA